MHPHSSIYLTMANLPEITYRYPTLHSGPQSDLRPEITIDWSEDMETTQFSNDALRAKNIVLMLDSTSTVLDTDYVSYTAADKRLVIQPSEDLDRNAAYRIIVKSYLQATSGRKSFNEYNWTFITASGAITEVTLLSPGEATVQPIFPTLSWQTLTGTGYNYILQLDDRWDFGSIDYQTVTTAGSAIASFGYTDSTTYYWRVRSYSAAATGMWSDVWSFYYGRSFTADPTSRQTLPDGDIFGVRRTGFKNGLSHQSAHPTLSFTFTSIPGSDYEDYIEAVYKSVLPRNDDYDTYDDSALIGSWALSGSTLTFTPTNSISNNTRYEIKFKSTMKNTVGYELDEEYTYYWTGKYSPFYVHPRVIRSRLLGAEQQIPDDLINYFIYLTSLEANARFYSGVEAPFGYGFGDSISETTVRDGARLRSYSVLKWTEAATTYHLIKSILFENLRDIGRMERLGDGMISLSDDFVKGITKALDLAKEEMDKWEEYLEEGSSPLTTSKSIMWPDYLYDWDASLNDSIYKRDDGF